MVVIIAKPGQGRKGDSVLQYDVADLQRLVESGLGGNVFGHNVWTHSDSMCRDRWWKYRSIGMCSQIYC